MKKFTYLKMMLLAVVMMAGSVSAWGQGTETFENHTLSGTNYVNGSFVGDNGIKWNYIQVTGEQDYSINGKGILLRRSDAPSSIKSSIISGGISSFSVKMRKAFTGTGDRQVALYINDNFIANSVAFGATSGADATVHTFSVSDINVAGDFTIEIRHITGNTSNRQLVIDDLTWTGYTGGTPTPTITSTPSTLSAFTADVGDAAKTQDITVTGANLTGDINVAITGADASQFSAASSLPAAGGTLTVTYTPSAAAATHSATLTLSSTGATDVIIPLNGETKEPLVLTGDGTEANPYTVADVKVLNNSLSTTAWVHGYIVGTPSGGNGTNLTTVAFQTPFSATAIALADAPGERDLTKMIGVQLPSGSVRTDLNLADNPTLQDRGVKVFGTLAGYFSGTPGVTGTSAYILDPTTGLSTLKTDAQAYTSQGKVMLNASVGELIEVFNVAGQKVVSRIAADGLNSVDVAAKGIMIVKVSNRVSKVIL